METALLLTNGDKPSGTGQIAKVLRFFGIHGREVSKAELLESAAAREQQSKIRLYCSAEAFLNLITDADHGVAGVPSWESFHSVFVYAEEDSGRLLELTNRLVGDETVIVQNPEGHAGNYLVTEAWDDFCGVMAGARIAASRAGIAGCRVLRVASEAVLNIISAGGGAVFLKFGCHGVPVFLSTGNRIIDLDAELATGIFDLRDHLMAALPLVLHVKWAFRKQCWQAAETNACLVIDDPLLKPNYGFVNFQELLALMKRHRFSTNVAFIPWNWQRSSPEVIQLFKENPEEFSLSVHGCDHTRAEFGSPDTHQLYWKARQGIERMARHEIETGIHHDPVMVFPQGVFSEAAMSALRHTGLIAAVSNDTISVDSNPRAIRVSDVWDVAVMTYSNFPLFTRRYPWEGVANFAFDILLGKPCIAVIHHDFCREGYQGLVEFIGRLNALNCPLSWRSLGEVVRRSCRQRELSPVTLEVEMYGTELRVGNRSGQPKRYLIGRRESDSSALKEVRNGSSSIDWKFSEGSIRFEIELGSGKHQTLSTTCPELIGNAHHNETLSYKTKIMFRRYLSEVRDNHLMKYQKRWSIDGQIQKTEDSRRRAEGNDLASEAGD